MAYRDSTTNSGSSATPGTTVPAGVAADDIVILVATIDASAAVFDTGDWPTGFTELAETALGPDGGRTAVGWKRLTGADGGSYTFGNLGASGEWVCQAFAFSGRHTTNPPVVSTTATDTNANNPPTVVMTANGVTAVDGDDLLWLGVPDVTVTGISDGITAPGGGYAEAEDAENGFSNLSGAYLNNVAAGATGTVAGSLAIASGQSGWAAWLVRIPLAGGGGPAPVPPQRLGVLGVS